MDKSNIPSLESLPFEKQTELRLFAIELNINNLFSQIEGIARKMQRLDEVYYKIFPERWERDKKFEDQLLSLNSPTDPSQVDKQP